MSTNKPKPFVAGGRRFTVGQEISTGLSIYTWIVEAPLPDVYGKGRKHNLIIAHNKSNPGIKNVFDPADLITE